MRSGVRTNLLDVKEDARHLRFEPIVGNTAVNVQRAIEQLQALIPTGSTGQTIIPTIVVASPYVPLATDTMVCVNSAGPVTINLPLASTRNNLPLVIKDISGAANTNNITINANVADTYLIDGLASVTIVANYGGYRLVPKVSLPAGWMISP